MPSSLSALGFRGLPLREALFILHGRTECRLVGTRFLLLDVAKQVRQAPHDLSYPAWTKEGARETGKKGKTSGHHIKGETTAGYNNIKA
jgi:hypothetical protein